MRNDILTQTRLKALLTYDPLTGIFTRISTGASVGYNLNGYLCVKLCSKPYRLNRLAHLYMTGAWPECLMDHKDTNKTNNKWDNLRPATHQQNNFNQQVYCTSKTGVKGVHKIRNRFRASLKLGVHHLNLGTYGSLDDAKYVRDCIAQMAQGEFFRV